MAPKYVKAVKGMRIKIGERGLEASETYHRDDNGQGTAATLPTVGSSAFIDPLSGSTFPYCVCSEYEGEFPEGDDTAVTYRFQYTTQDRIYSKKDPLARQFRSGLDIVSKKAEAISATGISGYTYLSDGVNIENMEIHRRVFNCQFAIPVVVSSTQFNSWITSTVAACAGKINGSTFDGWEIGTVLFEGVTGGSRYSQTGAMEWAMDLNFTLKIIPEMKNVTGAGTYGTASQYTWQHTWRGDKPVANLGWDRIVPQLYATAEFSALRV